MHYHLCHMNIVKQFFPSFHTCRKHGIFRLTTPGGMSVIRHCDQRGFHPHHSPSDGGPVYKSCTDVYMNPNIHFDVIDLRWSQLQWLGEKWSTRPPCIYNSFFHCLACKMFKYLCSKRLKENFPVDSTILCCHCWNCSLLASGNNWYIVLLVYMKVFFFFFGFYKSKPRLAFAIQAGWVQV